MEQSKQCTPFTQDALPNKEEPNIYVAKPLNLPK